MCVCLSLSLGAVFDGSNSFLCLCVPLEIVINNLNSKSFKKSEKERTKVATKLT